ncbi:hypothetical protein BDZ45DRAFT_691227 [Acephala macrosclerotiorum]|nr:hypothetical protein BDZ45DRAFT_691227 [Acephala macrosclerotiorum]
MSSITFPQNSTSPTTLTPSITSLISSSIPSISPSATSIISLTNSNCTTANSTYNNATGTCNNANFNFGGWDWTYMLYIIPIGFIVAWGLFSVLVLAIAKIFEKRWIQRGFGMVGQFFVGVWTAMARKRRERQENRVRKEAVELERRVEKAGVVAVEVL